MIENYLKVALRNLIKNKSTSLINIIGLSAGIGCAALILLWVQDEMNFDTFHKNAKTLYRIIQQDNNGKNSRSPAQLGPTLAASIPEIEAYTRVFKLPRLIVRQGRNIFYEDKGIIVDPQFLSMFDFPIVKGEAKTALSSPSNMIISESLAKKYFGNVDPLGKTLQIDGQNDVVITGVLKDNPGQSHIQFDFIMPFSLLDIVNSADVHNWGALNYTTYLQLRRNAIVQETVGKMNQIAASRMPAALLAFWKQFDLQPLRECHLSADVDNHHFLGTFTVVEDRNIVYLFSLSAFFILLLACINFMNLSTARSAMRFREIGIRKVVGSSRSQLVVQFIGEFLLLSTIASLLALGLVELILPYFEQMSGKQLAINHLQGFMPYLLIVMLTTILGGFYPALQLSSFHPLNMVKGLHRGPTKTSNVRSMLVVVQFAIAITLISGTLIVHGQMQYIQDKELGFQKENIVYMPIGGSAGIHYEAIKNELLKDQNILSVTAKDCLPTTSLRTLVDFYWDKKLPGENVLMELTGVDFDYFETLNISFVEGRSFSKTFPADAMNAFVLNEEAVKETGLESPVGKKFSTYNKSGVIVGVIKNTNFKSLHEMVNPQVYHLMSNIPIDAMYTGVMLVRVKGAEQAKALSTIENTWKRFNPNVPFEYHFLDQAYDKLYLSEQRTMTVFNWFCVIAIVIACLGLYGLAAFGTEQRTKEIGIRKVLGANVSGVVVLLTRDFIKWVVLAIVISWPVAYYVMDHWLQDFAYRVIVGPSSFVLAGALALAVAFITVGGQALKAALTNPVENLRYE